MKKILNFLMVMLLVMGLGMASVMTAFQAEAAETAETAGETVSAAETVLTANQDGEAALMRVCQPAVFMMRRIFCRRMRKRHF